MYKAKAKAKAKNRVNIRLTFSPTRFQMNANVAPSSAGCVKLEHSVFTSVSVFPPHSPESGFRTEQTKKSKKESEYCTYIHQVDMINANVAPCL